MAISLAHTAAFLISVCSFTAQVLAEDTRQTRPNPFATESSLPFQAPRFDLIEDRDYQPAFEVAMTEHLAEVQTIADNPSAPTFDNTIAELEKSGRMLDRVSLAFFGVVSANTNDTLKKVEALQAPKLSQHEDAINLNPKLFKRVKTLWDERASLNLAPEQAQVLKIYYDDFVHAGAQLSTADQTNSEDAQRAAR